MSAGYLLCLSAEYLLVDYYFTGRQKNRAVQLVYQTPSEVEGLTHITLEVEADDCHTIWKV